MRFAPQWSIASRLVSRRRLSAAVIALLCLCVTPAVLAQATASGCGPAESSHQVLGQGGRLLRGIVRAPRNAIRPYNLKWELPLAAATGLLIAEADRPAADRVQSQSLQRLASRWSNVGLWTEIAAGGVTWGIGCAEHKPGLRDAGLTALAAMGAAGAIDWGVKAAFDREYPAKPGGRGEFWGGGRSFPSGHAATSFAFAAAIAHRYPHKPWIRWGAYGLAAGVAMSRYPAKRHFLSDIVAGSALGYVTGTYLAGR